MTALDTTVEDEQKGRLRNALREEVRARLRPPPRLTVSEWADKFRMLSRESSAEPGRWRTSRVPYLRAIMDAFSSPVVERVSVQKPSQVGYTEVLNNVVGFVIDQDPGPILMVQPTVEMGKDWSKRRLANMLRDTPCLQDKVKDPRSRDSGNTITEKEFPGGQVAVVGSNAPAGLAARPIRWLLFDEVDRFEASAGSEGDPIGIAEKRTITFHNRKIAHGSSPHLKGSSRIEKSLADSVCHYYLVPCPACGELQRMIWKNKEGDYCLIFERDERTGRVEWAKYLCQHCSVLIDESEKYRMAAEGEWWHETPEGELKPGVKWSRHVGFRIDIFYSPWKEWIEIGQEFIEAKNSPELLQVFFNTTIGDSWEENLERMDPEALKSRRAKFPADVPKGVGILTAAVDVQDDRLEFEIDGWGKGQECWKTHYRINGDPAADEVWERLNAFLTRPYTHELGPTLRIRACAIDSGHHTDQVYRFCRGKLRQGVFPIKGYSQRGKPILGTAPKKPNKAGVRLFPVGTDTAKDKLFARLKIGQPGPGYIHFNAPSDNGGDDEYMAQFAAEAVVWRYEHGRRVRKYKQVRARNEAIDLGVYNFAALYWLGANVYDRLDKWVEKLESEAAGQAEGKSPEKPVRQPKRQKNWVTSW